MKMFKGLYGLLQSRKGALCLLILACATWACLKGQIDGTAYAAVIATIYSIYTFAHSRAEVAAITNDK